MRFPNTLAPSDPALGAAAPAARLLPVELTFGRLACKLDDGDAPRGPAFLFTVQREATLINRALGTDYEVSRSPRHYEIEPRRSISTKSCRRAPLASAGADDPPREDAARPVGLGGAALVPPELFDLFGA